MKIKLFLLFISIFTIHISPQTYKLMVNSYFPSTFKSLGENSKNVPSHFIFFMDVTDEIFGQKISSQIHSLIDLYGI
jgi:hypothetical protein